MLYDKLNCDAWAVRLKELSVDLALTNNYLAFAYLGQLGLAGLAGDDVGDHYLN